jgi:hypothetical protein
MGRLVTLKKANVGGLFPIRASLVAPLSLVGLNSPIVITIRESTNTLRNKRMSDIIRERFYVEGFECGECGGWVCKKNPTPCDGVLCGPQTENPKENDSEPPRVSQ